MLSKVNVMKQLDMFPNLFIPPPFLTFIEARGALSTCGRVMVTLVIGDEQENAWE